MEFKGTKGEWTVDDKIFYNEYNTKTLSIDFQPESMEHCVDVYIGDSEDELRANAKLIASAPDLLKALQKARFDLKLLGAKEGAPMLNDIDRTIKKALL